jgi:hypothetical protein
VRYAAVGLHWGTRVTGLLQLALGLSFWTGNLLALIPLHMANGLAFVVLLEGQAWLAAWARASWPLVASAVIWGPVVLVLGMTQGRILPGDFHWIIQVAHLLVGLAAMSLAERLASGVAARLVERRGGVPSEGGASC